MENLWNGGRDLKVFPHFRLSSSILDFQPCIAPPSPPPAFFSFSQHFLSFKFPNFYNSQSKSIGIMAPKIFMWEPSSTSSRQGQHLTISSSTGVTGYIGGDALYALEKAHPEYEYTALVRNSDRGAPVAAAFPKIRLVYGTLEDSKVLEEESARADVVLRKNFVSCLNLKSDLDSDIIYSRHCRCIRQCRSC